MFFLTPILVGLVLAGTLGAGAYVGDEAGEAVSQYNLSAISHVLTLYYLDHGFYPASLQQLALAGEIKNLDARKYSYASSDINQGYRVCVIDTTSCLSSTD